MKFSTIKRIAGNNHGALALSESLALKAVSLLLALILWITVLGFKKEELKKNIKLEPLLPPGMMIVNKLPSYIQFSVSGPRVLLKNVEKKDVPIRPDLRHTRDNTVVLTVSEDLIGDLPNGVRVTSFFPPQIVIRLEEVTESYVTVKPTLRGQIADGEEISMVKAWPGKVAVAGPRSLLAQLEAVGTESIDVTGLSGTKEAVATVEVDAEQGFRLSRDQVVKVKITTKKVK